MTGLPPGTLIYLDNNASTRTDPDVVQAMLPWFTETWANPSSIHAFAETSRDAIRQSRIALGRLIGCRPDDIVFTSGATEACNLAIFGAAEALPAKRHLIVTQVEHHAVLHPADRLASRGWEVTRLPVDSSGLVAASDVAASIRPDTLLVAAMFANNETGVILPVDEIGRVCRERGVLFLCDATQAVGRLRVNVRDIGADYLALSAHKFHGPKGVGALFVRRGAPLVSQLVGGGQQWDIRSGTENVPGIVGLGMAAWLAREHVQDGTQDAVRALRDRLEAAILSSIPGSRVNGAGAPRLPGTLSVAFQHAAGEAILQQLDAVGIAASSSSACQSNSTEPSHVMTAMRLGETWIHGVVRFGLSRNSTDQEIGAVAAQLPAIVARARASSPFLGNADADSFGSTERRP